MSGDRLKLPCGALADRYAIERELGRGGMAVVFLAYDRKLDRRVALKVLRPELAASLGPERFLREIEIAAKLTHPNILSLHDSGESDGWLFYTMPYVEGESLRDRLTREKQLPVEDALRITREVADALAHAHSLGVVHRDVKPENILFTAGHAVVSDFGIARAVSEAGADALTATGLAVGTSAYMSPEQATGAEVDGRSDVYALACVLYEMLSGETPYTGPTPQALLAKKLVEPAPRVSITSGVIPPGVEDALAKALACEPDDRFETTVEFAQALTAQEPASARVSATRALARLLRRPRLAVPLVAAILLLAFGGTRFFQHRAEIRWARQEALPEIERLIGGNDVWRNLVEPYRLAERAEAVLGDDPQLQTLIAQVSRRIDVVTEPAGARVYTKVYRDPDAEWSFLGVTPLRDVRVPIGIFRWKLEKEGYETLEAAASTWDVGGEEDLIAGSDLVRTLDETGSQPPGMVRVEATETPVGLIEAFFIGRYEVTNREYKAFVDAGGYATREYWKHPFVREGHVIGREAALEEFVDQTGRPGPSTWVGGDFPRGQEDYPVSGVSWYEADAYAEYAGMSLPTSVHWNVARGGYTPMVLWPQLGGFAVLAPFANFGGQEPVPVGSMRGLTAYGAYDMPGNVREWCWNEAPRGRVVRGGSWEDNTYEFGQERQAPPMDRSPRNGFRLAYYPEPDAVPEAAFAPHDIRLPFDARTHQPVSDAVFRAYLQQFAYDQTPLNARVESTEESPEGGWVHETVSFDAAYGGERVRAHLFLPVNTSPPWQTVIYFPGSASAWMPSSDGIESYYEFTMFLSFLVRNGRAVLYPVYKGTFERGGPEYMVHERMQNSDTHAYTEWVAQQVKDFRRSIDYLETREDIDVGRIAYYGMSWGGNMGAIIPAVEKRLRASVLVAAGLLGVGRPEVSDLNYVTHVTTPTLMLNGKYDSQFPPETSSRPMLDLLGTPQEDKRLILYETDHIPPRADYIKETLAWLDGYLGPVGR